jgi:excisionase family DNA binding protein
MTNDDFLTPADVGKLLGVAPATVRQMARQGTLPVAAKTQGGNRLFERQAVNRLLRKRAANRRTAKREARAG